MLLQQSSSQGTRFAPPLRHSGLATRLEVPSVSACMQGFIPLLDIAAAALYHVFFSLSQIFFTGPVAAGYRPQLPSRSPYLVRRRWHARRATRGGPTAARVMGHESPAYWPSYEDLSLIDD